MKEIQINPIGLQPVQAGINSILNMLLCEVCRNLGLQDNARSVAAGLQPAPNDLFRRMHLRTCFADIIHSQSVATILPGLASTVGLCRVEQGHAKVESGAHQPARHRLVDLSSERHASKPQPADLNVSST